MTFAEGIYNIYKPLGESSFKTISKLRKITGIKKIGHAGTLDPLADGVLIIAIGKNFTRQISSFESQRKEYVAKLTLGIETPTNDSESIANCIANTSGIIPERNQIEVVIENFLGEIEQSPPAFSAIHINGKRAYDLAREGKLADTDIPTKKVKINEIAILEYNFPVLKILVNCEKGTYIRSLARDLGKELGTGAYLSGLTRTKVGEFDISDSIVI